LLKVVLVLFQHPNTQTSHSLKRERERRASHVGSVFVWLVFI